MGVIGIWLEAAQQSGLVASLAGAGYEVVVLGDGEALPEACEALLADPAALSRHVPAVAGRKAAEAPVVFPVVAVLGPGAGDADIAAALTHADEVLRSPVLPSELLGRVRALLAGRDCSRTARDLEDCRVQGAAALAAATAALARRVKDLTCLSEVHAVIQRFDQPRAELFAGIAALLPPAMRRPDLAHARVLADGQVFASPGFRPGPYRQSVPLTLSGQSEAALEIYYDQEAAVAGGDAFSTGEIALARLVGQRLERTMARLGAEKALRREREFSALLMDTLPGGVVCLDRQGTFLFCNPRAEAILELDRRGRPSSGLDVAGFSAETLDGRPLASHEHPFVRVMATGRPVYDTAFSIARPDGGRRFIVVSGAPLFAADGSVEQVVFCLVDVTGQKAMERQLAHALKMESLGQLAAGIAHEINTPVQYVGGNLDFLANTFGRLVELLDRLTGAALAQEDGGPRLAEELAALAGDDELRFVLEEAPAAIRESREGLDRVASIVLSMKRFAHPGLESPLPVDMAQAIRDTLAVSRSAWKFAAEVETDIEADLPPVSFVPGDLNQVLLNIVVNAAQAIEAQHSGQGGKGHIAIRAVRRGDAVEVSIRDDGPGIPEAYRSRIFDPFFTTKPVGQGSGQGLAIVHAIMARHRARLDLITKEGEGTTFVLTLPLTDQPVLEA